MKELDKVVIRQVTQYPLDPDNIILVLKFKLLQTNLVKAKWKMIGQTSYFSA